MKLKLFLLLFISFFMTGCWNYSELSDMAIVSSVAVDIENEEYLVSFLITNAQKPDSDSQNNSATMTIISGKGNTVVEAINNIDLKMPKEHYLGHMSSLIISEDVAKNTLEVFDYFFRNPESIKKFDFIISKDKAVNTLKVISPLEIFPSESIISNLREINKEQGVISETLYSDFLNDVLTEGKNPVVATIKISGDIENADDDEDLNKTDIKTFIDVDSMALFSDYNFITYANKKESKGINIIRNKVKSLYVSINCDNGNSVSKANNLKTKISLKFEDNKPVFSISAEAEMQMQETTCNYDLEKDKVIKELEKKYAKEIKKIIKSAVDLAQKEKTDIFGFGNMVYKKNLSYWKKNNKKWDKEIFPTLVVEIKTKVNLISNGSIENTLKGAADNE